MFGHANARWANVIVRREWFVEERYGAPALVLIATCADGRVAEACVPVDDVLDSGWERMSWNCRPLEEAVRRLP